MYKNFILYVFVFFIFTAFKSDKPAYILFDSKGKVVKYERMLKQLLPDISESKIISFAVHDITANYVKDIQKSFPDISASKIISFKVHDIDKEYIKYVKGLVKGKELSASKVITFKVQGI